MSFKCKLILDKNVDMSRDMSGRGWGWGASQMDSLSHKSGGFHFNAKRVREECIQELFTWKSLGKLQKLVRSEVARIMKFLVSCKLTRLAPVLITCENVMGQLKKECPRTPCTNAAAALSLRSWTFFICLAWSPSRQLPAYSLVSRERSREQCF